MHDDPMPSGPWPRPADPNAAERLRERFAALGPAEKDLALGYPEVLACLGGNSPYLSELALREAPVLAQVLQAGPDAAVRDALSILRGMPPDAPRAQVRQALRRAKRQVALAVAVADLGAMWPLEAVTAALSDLADAALTLSCAHLLRAAHDAGHLRLPDPAVPGLGSGWIVLGMGKLGARELNYSSDVDLVLLYDPGLHQYHESGLGALFSRLTRDMVGLMEARDADGYVFRTDLRLRPDPAATPPCVSLPAALSYYESMAQNWERAAMIKARPVAGDIEAGRAFLAELRPFVWRRGLDFAAIADIHAMKRRVDLHKGTALAGAGTPADRVLGHDVKLGQGGIREIEFLAQTQQLVWGGRDPGLRLPATLEALPALAQAGRLSPGAAAELDGAYRILRGVEHRLQMVADRQTHALPTTHDALDRFAVFMGEAGADGFARALLAVLETVQRRWEEMFGVAPAAGASQDATSVSLDLSPLDLLAMEAQPDAMAGLQAQLNAMGFQDAAAVIAAVKRWKAGQVRALRTERARRLMNTVLPPLLGALARQTDPDAAFARLDRLLTRLPTGVPILSLFEHNPALLDRVAMVLGAAPSLADHLAAVPAALEGLLAPRPVDPAPARTLGAQLLDARAVDDAAAITRRYVRGEEFRLSALQLERLLDADRAGLARTALADAALSALLPRVLDAHADRYGVVPGGDMAVVLLGKGGGREMMAGSDLDLMLVYDHPADVGESTGAHPLPASTWFIRAAHAAVGALTAPGLGGPLYDVDMRLRPSGNKGPVAVPLPGFVRYHAEDAWTWEHMALTRARVVAGPQAMRRRVAAAIRAALLVPSDPETVREDARAMRARLLRDLPPSGPWDVKLRPGGQMEVEFICQVLQLIYGRANPLLFCATTRVALRRLARAGLLAEADAATLLQADRLWRTMQGLLRIAIGRRVPDGLPDPAARLLAAAAGDAIGRGVDLSELRATMNRTAEEVRTVFLRHVGNPGDPA